MAHEYVLVFSKEQPNKEKIEQIFDNCFYDNELDRYSVDGYGGIIEHPFTPNSIKDNYFMKLSDLRSLTDWEISENLNVQMFITIDNELRNVYDREILEYAKSLPETIWTT